MFNNIVVKFPQFWSILKILKFLLFPWQRRPFWKFWNQKSNLYLPLVIYNEFYLVWSILRFLDIFAVSMVTVSILKIPTTVSISTYAMLYIHKVSLSLILYSFRKGWFDVFSHRFNVKLFSSFHGNGTDFAEAKYCWYLRAPLPTFT